MHLTFRRFDHITYDRIVFTGNVYIADTSNDCIRKITVSTGIITTIAGTGAYGYFGDTGQATSATLNGPSGVALDSSGITIHASRHPQIILLYNLIFYHLQATCTSLISIIIVSARSPCLRVSSPPLQVLVVMVIVVITGRRHPPQWAIHQEYHWTH